MYHLVSFLYSLAPVPHHWNTKGQSFVVADVRNFVFNFNWSKQNKYKFSIVSQTLYFPFFIIILVQLLKLFLKVNRAIRAYCYLGCASSPARLLFPSWSASFQCCSKSSMNLRNSPKFKWLVYIFYLKNIKTYSIETEHVSFAAGIFPCSITVWV